MQLNYKDYSRENLPFTGEILKNIKEVLALKSEYEHEKYISAFEQEFASYNKSRYAIALNSGTTALELALRSCGVQRNDEVILPSYTYIATGLAVSNIGAEPVFADIKDDTLTIDPGNIKKKITKKTKAIIAVHIHGNPADMQGIVKIAGEYSLNIIEDCSHAHGAQYKGKKTGNFGIGCFSCHTDKNLGAIGNAGILTTNDKKIYERLIRMTRVQDEPDIGLSNRTPCRMDALQAAILRAKLIHLDTMIEKKRQIAQIYRSKLCDEIVLQKQEKNSKLVYRDFAVVAGSAQQLYDHLKKNLIQAKKGYLPLHLTSYYRTLLKNKLNPLPVTERIYKNILWLPLSFSLTAKEAEFICRKINLFFA